MRCMTVPKAVKAGFMATVKYYALRLDLSLIKGLQPQVQNVHYVQSVHIMGD